MLQTKQKSITLVCNSANKTADNKYVIPMNSLATEHVIGCSLKSIVYRNLFYNVVADGELKNNVFYFSLDAIEESFEVPEGFYKITDLIPIILAGIQTITNARPAIVQTVDLTYSALTGKVTLTITENGNGDAFRLLGKTYRDSINLILGNSIDVPIQTVLATPISYQFDSIIDLGGNDVANLMINTIAGTSGLSNSSSNSSGRKNGLLKMLSYVGSGFGELVEYQNGNILDTMIFYDSPKNLSNLNIWLETSSGVILDNGVSDLHIELYVHLK